MQFLIAENEYTHIDEIRGLIVGQVYIDEKAQQRWEVKLRVRLNGRRDTVSIVYGPQYDTVKKASDALHALAASLNKNFYQGKDKDS